MRTYWRKVCFSVFWRWFRGQIPIFRWVTPTFFTLKRFFHGYIITLALKREPSRWKNGHLTPKCVFRTPIPLQSYFWGQMPVFWWVTPIFFLWIMFLTDLADFKEKNGRFGWENGHLTPNWGFFKIQIFFKNSFLRKKPCHFR